MTGVQTCALPIFLTYIKSFKTNLAPLNISHDEITNISVNIFILNQSMDNKILNLDIQLEYRIYVNACNCNTKNLVKGLRYNFSYSISVESRDDIPSEIHAIVLNYFVDESNYLNINTELEF